MRNLLNNYNKYRNYNTNHNMTIVYLKRHFTNTIMQYVYCATSAICSAVIPVIIKFSFKKMKEIRNEQINKSYSRISIQILAMLIIVAILVLSMNVSLLYAIVVFQIESKGSVEKAD